MRIRCLAPAKSSSQNTFGSGGSGTCLSRQQPCRDCVRPRRFRRQGDGAIVSVSDTGRILSAPARRSIRPISRRPSPAPRCRRRRLVRSRPGQPALFMGRTVHLSRWKRRTAETLWEPMVPVTTRERQARRRGLHLGVVRFHDRLRMSAAVPRRKTLPAQCATRRIAPPNRPGTGLR